MVYLACEVNSRSCCPARIRDGSRLGGFLHGHSADRGVSKLSLIIGLHSFLVTPGENGTVAPSASRKPIREAPPRTDIASQAATRPKVLLHVIKHCWSEGQPAQSHVTEVKARLGISSATLREPLPGFFSSSSSCMLRLAFSIRSLQCEPHFASATSTII